MKDQKVLKRIKVRRGEQTRSESGYKFDGLDVLLPNHDCDIDIHLPNGGKFLLQWRIENETVDICLNKKMVCYLFGEDLSPPKKTKEKDCYRVDQLTFMDIPKEKKKGVKNELRDSLSEILEEPGLMIPEELRKAGIEACKAHERTLARREHA
jgi:hypothetical protein